MPRAIGLIALAMIGCGRLSFEPAPTDGTDPIDAPPVPAAICKVDRIPFDQTPSLADLAIAPTSEGYAAIWIDTTGAQPAHGLVLGPNHGILGSLALPDIMDTALGGITDVGGKLVLASATGAVESVRILGRDLQTVTLQSTLMGHLMGHDPYPSDANQSRRAFLTGRDNTLEMSYVATDGLINLGQPGVFIVSGTVTDLACTDGPDHAHCVWAEKLPSPGGSSQCTITDIDFALNAPAVGSRIVVSSDCYELRNASGPVPADSMIVVWTTQAHELKAHYAVSTGDRERLITQTGSAPKVRFDGTRFWIAWLDGGGLLQLSSFDINGTTVNYSLAGWTPNGPEAFEVVNRGNETGVMLVSPNGLDILTICS